MKKEFFELDKTKDIQIRILPSIGYTKAYWFQRQNRETREIKRMKKIKKIFN